MTLVAEELPAAQKRCAIYTRRSAEHPLTQEFNSLEAQQAMCSAYIDSQRHKGWRKVDRVYEDAAQSGRTLERPAMQELLADIERGRVDVVVVYKLDRLSRSLLDFVALIEVFDRYGVSFVCITQNFDTADSLGRLVMNVLLTFAQFEREMTGDRIRDKRRAMALKGLWSGGRPPIGYDLVDHHLVPSPAEAAVVRDIYEAFLRSGNLRDVARMCTRRDYRSKSRVSARGAFSGGVPLRAASVRKILMNRVYAGYIVCSGRAYRGVHEPLISEELWDAVTAIRQQQIAERRNVTVREVLEGLVYDCFGRGMSVNRQQKGGKLHCHFRSNQNEWGERHSVKRMRVSARELEQLVISAIQELLQGRERLRAILVDMGRSGHALRMACRAAPVLSRRLAAMSRDQLRSVLHALISHIEVSRERVKVVTRALEYEHLLNWNAVGHFRRRTEDTLQAPRHVIDIPCAGAIRLERYVRLPIAARNAQTYRINKSLRKLISDAQSAWAAITEHRELSPAEIAQKSNMSQSYFMRLLRLNYLAPDIVTSILDGAQPKGLTRRALIDANLPLDWALQRKLFGFPEQPPMRTAEQSY